MISDVGGGRTRNLLIKSQKHCQLCYDVKMWNLQDSNLRPSPCKGDALNRLR